MQWLHDMPGIGLKTALLLLQFHKPCCPSTPDAPLPAGAGPDSAKASADKPTSCCWPTAITCWCCSTSTNTTTGTARRLFQASRLRPLPFKGFCNYYLEHHGPIHPGAATPPLGPDLGRAGTLALEPQAASFVQENLSLYFKLTSAQSLYAAKLSAQ
jgi:endonuclease-3